MTGPMVTGPDTADAGGAAPDEADTTIDVPAAPTGVFPGRHRPRRLAAAWRHWLFALLLLAGAALRALAMYAFRPVFEFDGDSSAYLGLAKLWRPDPAHPAGYPALLRLLAYTDQLVSVPLAQHLLGLAAATALYALLAHRGCRPLFAALATVPVLLDPYQVVLEHFVMAETLFVAFVVAAAVTLLWSRRPPIAACAVAAGLFGLSGLVRTVGVALGVLALLYVAARRLGWLRFLASAVLLLAPLVGYASWYHAAHGQYALSGGGPALLYGRVAPIADCARLHLTDEQRTLCPTDRPADRPGPNFYVRSTDSPRFLLPDEGGDAALSGFARQVIRHQPLDYLRMVALDAAHYFAPGHYTGARDWPDGSWQFPTADPPDDLHLSSPLTGFDGETRQSTLHEPVAGWLRTYQRFVFTPGPLLAACAAFTVVAWVLAIPGSRRPGGRIRRPEALDVDEDAPYEDAGSGLVALGLLHDGTEPSGAATAPARPRGWLARRRDRTRLDDPVLADRRRGGVDTLLLVLMALAVVALPSATAGFDYRYGLPLLVVLPTAAALTARQLSLWRVG